MIRMIWNRFLGIALLFSGCTESPQKNASADAGWEYYGGNAGGLRYSPLIEVNRSNVHKLEIAWTYRTGESPKGASGNTLSECTPILADGKLYVCTPLNQVMALDPASGKELWRYDPKVSNHHYANGPTCRGVTTWRDRTKRIDEPFARIIFIGTNDGRLIALDAKRGTLNPEFGDKGVIDLKQGMGEKGEGNYQVTSPPAILNDLVIVGSSINDNEYQNEARGTVRAYDTRTGNIEWSWDPIPQNAEDPAYLTWENGSATKTGAANVWSVISVDEDRDLVFLPTSSPSVDYYGGERLGENLYANSVVALRGSTGEFVWGFQVVHHDLWDYDIAAQPTLVDLIPEGNPTGNKIPALVQGTKMGNLFVLNRETGKPIFPIEERNVPQSTVKGEKPWPTQPFPKTIEPLVPQSLTKEDLFGIDEADKRYAKEIFENLHYDGIFTPGSEQGSLIYPGNIGGVAWGGVAVDPIEQVVIANTNRLGAIIKLIPRELAKNEERKESETKVAREIQKTEIAEMNGTPYILARSYFISSKGIPCTPPPWGALSAISLKNGKKLWEVPLGIFQGLKNHPEANKWGSLNFGGPLVTAGGLVLIAATMDDTLRAFDRDTGELLWEHPLPAGAQATPMTYRLSDGKQYFVINAGGHGRLKTTPGDYFIAFALPD